MSVFCIRVFRLCFCFVFSCMQVLSQIHGVASKNKSWLLPYLKFVPRLSPSTPLRISPRETPAKVGLCHAHKPFFAVLLYSWSCALCLCCAVMCCTKGKLSSQKTFSSQKYVCLNFITFCSLSVV